MVARQRTLSINTLLNAHRPRPRSLRPLARSIADAPSSPQTEDPHAYCKNFVRQHDYEGFLISQFYAGDNARAYFALKAFSNELAMIQDSVSNILIGEMRMQFWRDVVKGITDGRPPHHPIALALYDASKTANLAPYHLKRIVDARANELQAPVHLTVDSLTSHAESTASTLLYLLMSVLNLSSETLSHAASHVGVAQSISILLRALPYHAAKGRMVIPAEITAKHAVSQEEVFRKGPSAQGIDNAVFDFATLANDHILTARDMLKETGGKVPAGAMPIFSTAIPVTTYLERLEAVNFDAFHPSLQQRYWKLPWRVWRSYYKSTF
ncbi:hypothetical protein FA95DRAFT_270299 [Auriscalpium vulgare]|uniref:Uncharacterized protein n=1 Tax=Auriscalpium vulgare TaxID=40419 RepID=A0ACB8S5S6_9AGAM|nr:hypothetical protein FA95DRAFT_270299 [Auriscalpium vulgare]